MGKKTPPWRSCLRSRSLGDSRRSIRISTTATTVLLALALGTSGGRAAAKDSSPPWSSAFRGIVELFAESDSFAGVVAARDAAGGFDQLAFGPASRELGVDHDPDSVVLTGSVSKLIVATTVLRLVERGLLDLEDPLIELLPGADPGLASGITLRHLLTHRAGLPGIARDVVELETFRRQADGAADHRFVDQVLALDREGRPGERRVYGNLAYDLVQLVLERRGGAGLGEVTRRTVLDPLGMNRTGLNRRELLLPGRVPGYVRSPQGSIHNARVPDGGSFYSTAHDLTRLVHGILGRSSLTPSHRGFFREHLLIEQSFERGDGTSVLVLWSNGVDSGYSCELMYFQHAEIAVAVVSNLSPLRFDDLRRSLATGLPDASEGRPRSASP